MPTPQKRFAATWSLAHHFEPFLAELAAYRATFGDSMVPSRYVNPSTGCRLGRMVAKARHSYAKGTMPKDRVARLEQLGLVWSVHDLIFAKNLEALKAHVAATKAMTTGGNAGTGAGAEHPSAPPRLDPGLKSWIAAQLERYRAGKLKPDRLQSLRALGFLPPAAAPAPAGSPAVTNPSNAVRTLTGTHPIAATNLWAMASPTAATVAPTAMLASAPTDGGASRSHERVSAPVAASMTTGVASSPTSHKRKHEETRTNVAPITRSPASWNHHYPVMFSMPAPPGATMPYVVYYYPQGTRATQPWQQPIPPSVPTCPPYDPAILPPASTPSPTSESGAGTGAGPTISLSNKKFRGASPSDRLHGALVEVPEGVPSPSREARNEQVPVAAAPAASAAWLDRAAETAATAPATVSEAASASLLDRAAHTAGTGAETESGAASTEWLNRAAETAAATVSGAASTEWLDCAAETAATAAATVSAVVFTAFRKSISSWLATSEK